MRRHAAADHGFQSGHAEAGQRRGDGLVGCIPVAAVSAGVNVTVAVCTELLSWPVKMTRGVDADTLATDTPEPLAETAKSGVAWPGSRAPVLDISAMDAAIISPAYSRRDSETVSVAVSEASPSDIVMSELVSETVVDSLSWISILSDGSSVDTV